MSDPSEVQPREMLPFLPKEIIKAISLHLGYSNLRAFALTCRSINSCCSEKQFWKGIEISIHPRFGEHPYVYPDGIETSTYDRWAVNEAKLAGARRAAEVKRKVWAVLNAADERRWGMVEVLTLVVSCGGAQSLLQVLDGASASLQSLELEALTEDGTPVWSSTPDYDTLDFRSLSAGIHFPSLSQINIGTLALRFHQYVAVLCNSAPNLISLILDLSARPDLSSGLPALAKHFPSFERATKISQLHLQLPPWLPDSCPSSSFVGELFLHTPHLEVLDLNFDPETPDVYDVARHLLPLVDLGALCWDVSPTDFEISILARGDAGRANFGARLRRLVLETNVWHEMVSDIMDGLTQFHAIPRLPQLQILLLDLTYEPPLSMSESPLHSTPNPARSMTPKFARGLRDCPQLRAIHTVRDYPDHGSFDLIARAERVQDTGIANGHVRSYKHGGSEELLHVRYLSDYFEVADELDKMEAGGLHGPERMLYQGISEWRVKVYERRSVAGWQELSNYRDRVVPLEIISAMQVVEGASDEDWARRGVEVGAAAWQVLTDWVDGQE